MLVAELFLGLILLLLFVGKWMASLDWLQPTWLVVNILAWVVYLFAWRNYKRLEEWRNQLTADRMRWFVPHLPLQNKPLKLLLFRSAWFCMTLALAQPVIGKQTVKVSGKRGELLFVVDLSNSMNTADMGNRQTRLEVVKRAMTDVVNNCKGEKLGIAIFADRAFLQLPMTKDYGAVKLFIQDLETSMISQQGTNMQAAMEVAQRAFSKQETGKALWLFTDGENHDTLSADALDEWRSELDQLALIAVGSKKGGPVPLDAQRPELGYLTLPNGQGVISKVDSQLLRQLAKAWGGAFVWVQNEFPNLSELLTEFNRKSTGKSGDLSVEIARQLYFYPLLLSLGFWWLFGWVSAKSEK